MRGERDCGAIQSVDHKANLKQREKQEQTFAYDLQPPTDAMMTNMLVKLHTYLAARKEDP